MSRIPDVHPVALDAADERVYAHDDQLAILGDSLAHNADVPEVECLDERLYSLKQAIIVWSSVRRDAAETTDSRDDARLVWVRHRSHPARSARRDLAVPRHST